MGDVADFKTAQLEKSHERKEAKLNKIKGSFKSSREASEPKSKAVKRLKMLFKNPANKKPPRNSQ